VLAAIVDIDDVAEAGQAPAGGPMRRRGSCISYACIRVQARKERGVDGVTMKDYSDDAIE
jgi:hypothetical protein